MNITDVHVDGFGVWRGLRLRELSTNITVFHGPNEAGKTTLLQFIRSVLYGFPDERRARYLPPRRGGRPGGALHVSSPRGLFEISRHVDDARDPLTGELRVLADDGAVHGERLLRALLADVDETTFNNVFAVGLREMQELGTLGDTAAADLMYKLTTGLDRVSLVDVMRELAASRNRLLAADDRPSRIAQLLNEREHLQGEIEQLQDGTREFARLAADRKRLDADVAQAEAAFEDLERAIRLHDAAAAVREKWHKRQLVRQELESLGEVPELPPGILDEFEHCAGNLAAARRHVVDLKQEHKRLRGQIEALGINEPLVRQAPWIEALAEQHDWISALETDVQSQRTDLARLRAELTAEQERQGLHGESAAQARAKITSATLAKLRPVARQCQLALVRHRRVRQDAQQAGEAITAHAAEIQKALAGREDKQLQVAIERAGGQVAQLRRRAQVDERLDQMSRHRADLADQAAALLDRQLLPPWAVTLIGSVFIVGVVLFLSGLFLPESFMGPAGTGLAVFGLFAAGTAVMSKLGLERTATQKLDECQSQLGMLDAQIKQSKDERDRLDELLPRGGGPVLMRLDAAEKDLAGLESLLAVEARRQGAEKDAQAARARSEESQKQVAVARKRWHAALAALGMPPSMSPKQLREFAARGDQLDELVERVVRHEQDMQRGERELHTLNERIAHVMSETKLRPLNQRAADQLRQLRHELTDQQGRVTRRDEMRKRIREIRGQLARHLRSGRHEQRRRHELLLRAGVTEVKSFRQRVAACQRAAALREQQEFLSLEIGETLGPHVPEDAIGRYFEQVTPAEVESHGKDLTRRRQVTHQQLQALVEQRGRLRQQLNTLAEDRRLPGKLLDLSIVEEQLRQATERWQVLALTHRILAAIRRTYEAEHQPESLKEASGYLARMTEGRYVRVWTPLDEDTLRVDDPQGHSLPVDVLSCGTREQLFLSLRLALVSQYARRGARLPVVLDDVLVNFDQQRAQAAAAVLCDFAASGAQVLVFTCHEHIARLFQTLRVPVRLLPNNNEIDAEAVGYTVPEWHEPAVATEPAAPPPVPLLAAPAPVEPEIVLEPPRPVEPPRREALPPLPFGELVRPAPAPVVLAPPTIELPPPLEEFPDPEPVRVRPALPRINRQHELFAGATWHEQVEVVPDVVADRPDATSAFYWSDAAYDDLADQDTEAA